MTATATRSKRRPAPIPERPAALTPTPTAPALPAIRQPSDCCSKSTWPAYDLVDEVRIIDAMLEALESWLNHGDPPDDFVKSYVEVLADHARNAGYLLPNREATS